MFLGLLTAPFQSNYNQCLAEVRSGASNFDKALAQWKYPHSSSRPFMESQRSENAMDWTGGYVADIGYTANFYREIAPSDAVRLECLGRHWFLDLDDAREKVEEWRTENCDLIAQLVTGRRCLDPSTSARC